MLRHFVRDNDGSTAEITDRVRIGTSAFSTNADEGSVGSCQVVVEDPYGTFNVRGHRRYYARETEAEADAYGGIVYTGYTADRKVTRGSYRTLTGRQWTLQLVDFNSLLSRRILRGSDCKRGAESDIERVLWVLNTAEISPVVADEDYIATGSGVAMDAVDYTGQNVLDVLDDCAQQSGRNYHLVQEDDQATFRLWYQKDSVEDRTSAIRISNVLADVDSVTTFAPARESELTRDPSRVFSGVFQTFDGGYRYVKRDQTAIDFASRDTTGRAENVKTAAKAEARARRYVNEIKTETDTITTAIIVGAANVNVAKEGQRMEVKFSHFPGYEDYRWMRIIDRTVRDLSPLEAQRLLKLDTPVDGLYELALRLQAPEPGTGDEVGEVYGVLYYGHGPYADGGIGFEQPGDTPPAGWPFRPTTGALTALTDSSYPAGRQYSGWQIDGDGTVDVLLHLSVTGVLFVDTTFTFAILLNGAVVASESVSLEGEGLPYIATSAVVTAPAVAVSTGDVISATVTASANVAFITVPAGIGGEEVLEITGGTLT